MLWSGQAPGNPTTGLVESDGGVALGERLASFIGLTGAHGLFTEFVISQDLMILERNVGIYRPAEKLFSVSGQAGGARWGKKKLGSRIVQ